MEVGSKYAASTLPSTATMNHDESDDESLKFEQSESSMTTVNNQTTYNIPTEECQDGNNNSIQKILDQTREMKERAK